MNRRVRLPNGKWITRKLAESPPELLATAKPEEIWTTSEGTRIRFRDMEASHLVNCLRILTQQAFSKMRLLGILSEVPEFKDVETHNAQLGRLLSEMPEKVQQVIAFAEKTIPQFKPMRDELEIKLGYKQRQPEPVPEATGRKFDFSL